MTLHQETLLPEELRKEFIDDRWISSPRPTGKHLLVVSNLQTILGSAFHFGRGGPGGWWILVEPQVLFGKNKLIPDLAGWRKERLPEITNDSIFEVIPDWVCEVVSPGSRKVDRQIKPPIYLKEGTKFFWLIEPDIQRVEAFSASENGWVVEGFYEGDDKAKIRPFEAIEIDLLDLWGVFR